MKRLKRFLSICLLALFANVAWAEPLDINTATVEQIAEAMTGVGKAKAETIVKDRETNGKFKSIEDLNRVKGIGKATVEKNRDKIAVK